MKHLKQYSILLLVFGIYSCNNLPKVKKVEESKEEQIYLKRVAGGLTAPVALECPKDGSRRLFVCEQNGKIRIIKDGNLLVKPFLDFGSHLAGLDKSYSEKGLLGLAFHPQYRKNGRFFVYYSASDSIKENDHKSIVAEYRVSGNPDLADSGSGKIILQIGQPEGNHNGGQLAFGRDGMLYIGSGDGGGAGDRHGELGNGQKMNTLLGKILRIDVDSKFPYAIPADNPFLNNPKIVPEIWAYGLRNPWRFSFDRETGNLFCGDVGQYEWEEIDIIQKGKNYGWRIMEGTHCFEPPEDCNAESFEMPVAEYSHKTGICVIGGYVYRGNKIQQLKGKYIFADWNGKLFFLEPAEGKWKMKEMILADLKDNNMGENINSFGEDENGEVYILSQKTVGPYEQNGSVYRIDVR